MSALATAQPAAVALEKVLISGDLSPLTPAERVNYYKAVCDSVGLNPLTKPFEYLELNRKLTLYALKAATDQLRSIRRISLRIVSREMMEGVYVVTAQATEAGNGRIDESTGVVAVKGLQGEALANALMKAETKAKRRVTLSLCGLGMLDETEVADIPQPAPQQQRPVRVTSAPGQALPPPLPPQEPEPPELNRDGTPALPPAFWSRDSYELNRPHVNSLEQWAAAFEMAMHGAENIDMLLKLREDNAKHYAAWQAKRTKAAAQMAANYAAREKALQDGLHNPLEGA